MALPNIGSFVFVGWGAQLKNGSFAYRLFEQMGVAGYGVVFGALKTPAQMVPTLYRASSEADATNTLSGYRSLATTSVTINDPVGYSWTNSVILDVNGVVSFDPIGYVVRATWTVLLPSI